MLCILISFVEFFFFDVILIILWFKSKVVVLFVNRVGEDFKLSLFCEFIGFFWDLDNISD